MYGYLKKRKIAALSSRFLSLQTEKDLAFLLGCPVHKLKLLVFKPEYIIFEMKKKNGVRLIEAPTGYLKKYLVLLKNHMQAVYYYVKSDAAYGFVISPGKDEAPRNILTNARQHLCKKHLLNIDLSNFFHQVKYDRVNLIFQEAPFYFEKKLAALLTDLTTYNSRLSMGSPTSPPLSNFAMLEADRELLQWTEEKGITYTRYVDDLSFSSDKEINAEVFTEIESLLSKHGFHINYDKVRSFSEKDIKMVTGLELIDQVKIPDKFLTELSDDLDRFKSTCELYARMPDRHTEKWLEKLEQAIRGKINFIGLIYGKKSHEYSKYCDKFENILEMDEEIESLNWLEFPYQF